MIYMSWEKWLLGRKKWKQHIYVTYTIIVQWRVMNNCSITVNGLPKGDFMMH